MTNEQILKKARKEELFYRDIVKPILFYLKYGINTDLLPPAACNFYKKEKEPLKYIEKFLN